MMFPDIFFKRRYSWTPPASVVTGGKDAAIEVERSHRELLPQGFGYSFMADGYGNGKW